ncbi:MAG: energy-coupling factor transporter transmembrane protein EcfT [Syntrophobacteraceae bacterium]
MRASEKLTMLSLRVMNSLSVSFLVLASTPFMEFVKGLKVLRIPDIFLMTITLSYKYIFIFTTIVHDMHLAKKSRLAGAERHAGARKWVAGRIALLYHKSQQRCEEVFRAMVARGLSDSVKHPVMQPLQVRDRFACLGFLTAAIVLYWI